MANRNHALDRPILESAFKEFTENGYRRASLRKIALNAGVTVGAMYTRYQSKDELFCALAEPLIERINQLFDAVRDVYLSDTVEGSPEQLAAAMSGESDAVLQLLFEEYDRAKLLICCSDGSSLENFFNTVVERKLKEILAFFKSRNMSHPNPEILRFLISTQFHMYYEIIEDGCTQEEAKNLMDSAMVYHIGGWTALLSPDKKNTKKLLINGRITA